MVSPQYESSPAPYSPAGSYYHVRHLSCGLICRFSGVVAVRHKGEFPPHPGGTRTISVCWLALGLAVAAGVLLVSWRMAIFRTLGAPLAI